jgi:hypothetical protein
MKEKRLHMVNQELSAKQQIKNLLLVISSGILCALLISLFFVYNYGPSGQYIVRNALLSPDVLEKLSFNDIDTKTGKMTRFDFEGIEFTYYDIQKQWKRNSISTEQYRSFYKSIDNDVSILDESHAIESLFNKEGAATLTLKVSTENRSEKSDEIKNFQQVNFVANGDYYRIELRESKSPQSSKWAYYHHPMVYQSALQHFSSQVKP